MKVIRDCNFLDARSTQNFITDHLPHCEAPNLETSLHLGPDLKRLIDMVTEVAEIWRRKK